MSIIWLSLSDTQCVESKVPSEEIYKLFNSKEAGKVRKELDAVTVNLHRLTAVV